MRFMFVMLRGACNHGYLSLIIDAEGLGQLEARRSDHEGVEILHAGEGASTSPRVSAKGCSLSSLVVV